MKKSTKPTKKKPRTITFQPTDEVLKLLPAGMAITGKTQSKLINEAIKRKLPQVIKEMEQERERAKRKLEDSLPSDAKGK